MAKGPVLVHEKQNSGKSTFCRWLCPPALSPYIAENIAPDKDGHIALSTNLYINLDELATLNKQELNGLKALFSKDVINVRRPFDRKATSMPRRASFTGSTNDRQFLTDLTGSVRWLCFEIEKIDWDYSKAIDVNRLYAQAYELYRSGFRYQLSKEELDENEGANSAHLQSSAELELVQQFCKPGDQHHTATDILIRLTALAPTMRLSAKAIGQALSFIGIERKKVGRTPQSQRYGYYLAAF
jgi:predicted P-loop ATPase